MVQSATRSRALVVEDDGAIRELLRFHLDLAGYDIEESRDGRRGLERARAQAFDLILLDVMLPGLDGVSLCKAVRADGPNVGAPIVMLTARDGESDTVLGLESGADDYLTKPFGVRELMARIAAVTRRHRRADGPRDEAPDVVACDGVMLDRDRRHLTVRGTSVDLTKQEFDLLYLLMSKRGIVFTRAALLRKVWSDDTYVTERTVDAVISRLRRKIEEDPQDPALLLTAWGTGYKFADSDS
jgi:DNA-binding response OmpR family regulator